MKNLLFRVLSIPLVLALVVLGEPLASDDDEPIEDDDELPDIADDDSVLVERIEDLEDRIENAEHARDNAVILQESIEASHKKLVRGLRRALHPELGDTLLLTPDELVGAVRSIREQCTAAEKTVAELRDLGGVTQTLVQVDRAVDALGLRSQVTRHLEDIGAVPMAIGANGRRAVPSAA
jgi:hypothetical protein